MLLPGCSLPNTDETTYLLNPHRSPRHRREPHLGKLGAHPRRLRPRLRLDLGPPTSHRSPNQAPRAPQRQRPALHPRARQRPLPELRRPLTPRTRLQSLHRQLTPLGRGPQQPCAGQAEGHGAHGDVDGAVWAESGVGHYGAGVAETEAVAAWVAGTE